VLNAVACTLFSRSRNQNFKKLHRCHSNTSSVHPR